MNKYMYILEEFLDDIYYQKGSSKNTVSAYRVDILDFFNTCDNDIFKISKENIFTHTKKLKDKYAQNTVLRKLSSIKNFLKFIYTNEYIKEDFSVYIENVSKTQKIPEILKLEEIKRILDSYSNNVNEKRIRVVLEILLATGARISEIVNLKISDVVDNDYEYIKVFGKGSKYRLIPIYDSLRETIKHFIENYRNKIDGYLTTDKIFVNLRRERVYLSLKEHAIRVGIEKHVYPHIFRHSVASYMLKNGADIRIVQEILGHSNISTTQIYTHVEKSALKKAYNTLDFGGEDD